METRYIEIWNDAWNINVTESIRSIDGVDLHDAHVHALKEELYSAISDLSKSANGFRHRLDINEYSVAELDELVEHFGEASERECERVEKQQAENVVKFEARILDLIACGAKDRETALRWLREAQDEYDRMYGDDWLEYSFNLPYGYLRAAS